MAPDPESRTGAWVVGIATAVAAAVYLVGNVIDGLALTPEFTRTVLTQVTTSDVVVAFRAASGVEPPLGLYGELIIGAYTVFPVFAMSLPFDNPAAIGSVILLRGGIQLLNLAGAPLLYAAARRGGLRDGPAILAALAYLLSPFLADKIAWDLIGYMGTGLILAYWALQAGRHWLAFLGWFIASGGHPFALWAVALWVLAEWLAAERAGRPSKALRLGAVWFPFHALVMFTIVFIIPAIEQGTLVGYLREHVSSERFALHLMPWHALATTGLVAGFLFLPLARARWLFLLVADLIYYTGTGLNHGLIPATTGMLAIIMVEALRSAQIEGAGWQRPGIFRRLALFLAGPAFSAAAVRRALVLLPLALLVANAMFPVGNPWRRAVRGVEWYQGWIPDVTTVADAAGREVDLCLAQPYAFGAVDDRCSRVLPWSWPETGRPVEVDEPDIAWVVTAALYARSPYRERTFLAQQDMAMREFLCDGLAEGRLSVLAQAGSACAIVPAGSANAGTGGCRALCEGRANRGAR
jgi:hypothetical protein